MKNVHMMLPPNYRDLWKGEFQALKVGDVKLGNGWMYETDPFAAKQEREEAQALIAKKRDEVRRQKEREEKQPVAPGPANNAGQSRNVLRGWTNVPTVDMGKRMRSQVEELIRQYALWNPHRVSMPDAGRKSLVNELHELGFRTSHVEEAAAECKDREEVIEWLLIHVPEDDLPRWCLPEGYVTGISMANGNIKRESSVRRLADAGYSTELCERLLNENNGNEMDTAEALQSLLVHDLELESHFADLTTASVKDEDTWSEEMETLASIYGDRYKRNSDSTCQFQLEVHNVKDKYVLYVQKPKVYPSRVPVLKICGNGLPAYMRLSIYRQAIKYAYDTPLLGVPMVFTIIDWLEANMLQIMNSPGKLRDIAAAASSVPGPASQGQHSRHTTRIQPHPRMIAKVGNSESATILRLWQARQKTAAQSKMMLARQSLPAWGVQDILVKTVNENQVTIISGETGSGKSTQSVQFVLDDLIQRGLGASANIICTQPRRISALSLADRVSEERCSAVGHEVGYTIRGESESTSGKTKITFVTTGVLLRRLQTSGGSREDVVAALADVSHVVVDEVHERSLDTDFLLVLLRDVLEVRKDLKVILMSATLDASIFETYFESRSSVGKIEIQGRTFPVIDHYLDDVIQMTRFNSSNSVSGTIQSLGMQINYDIIAATVSAIDVELGATPGGILIFLPGVVEINRTLDMLRAASNIYALPLHASLTPMEQRLVFPPAPKGRRKVIVATNVAETSSMLQLCFIPASPLHANLLYQSQLKIS